MRRLWLRSLLALVACLSLSITAACTRRPTQLLVVVDSDLPPDERACVAARVSSWDVQGGLGPMDQSFFFFDGRTPGGPQLPFSFAVLPPHSGASRVQLEVVALRAADCDPTTPNFANARVRRIVRSGFASEQTLRLPIFLAASCIPAACVSTEDCEGGMCQVVQEVGRLTPVVPGQEFEDASTRDAGVDAFIASDAANDANLIPIPFSPTRTAPTFSLALDNRAGTDTEHNAIYPVGSFERTLLFVAGLSVNAQASAAIPLPDPRVDDANAMTSEGDDAVLFLTRMNAPSTVVRTTTWRSGGYPYPIITRALDAAGDTLLCGTMGSTGMEPFAAAPMAPLGCASRRCAFVARIDSTGAQSAFHVIDTTDGSAEVWCTDIDVIEGRVMLALHVSASIGGALRINGTPVSPAFFDPTLQNALTMDVGTPAMLSVTGASPVTVVGHDTALNPTRVDLGAVVFHRSVAGGGWAMAASTDVLARGGAAPTGAQDAVHFLLNDGTTTRASRMLITNGTLILRNLVTSARTTWAVVSVVGVSGSTALRYEINGRIGPPVMLPDDRTYLVRVEPTTIGAVSMTRGIERSADDVGAADVLGSQLLGHGLAASAEGFAFYATDTADGESLGNDTIFRVTGELDPLLAFASPTPVIRRAWQWDTTMEGSGVSPVDWRLTHAVWVAGGWIAVAGYVENNDDPRWMRGLSYFSIYPAF